MDLISLAAKLHALEVSDWTVVVSGISIVIGTLALLIVVFYIFGAIVSKSQAAQEKKAAKKMEQKMVEEASSKLSNSAPVKATAPAPAPAPVVEEGISGEVVAAISAAVYSMEGGNATIRSIKRQSPITARNPWAQASVIDNTRPF